MPHGKLVIHAPLPEFDDTGHWADKGFQLCNQHDQESVQIYLQA
jgi:hypothetical protein